MIEQSFRCPALALTVKIDINDGMDFFLLTDRREHKDRSKMSKQADHQANASQEDHHTGAAPANHEPEPSQDPPPTNAPQADNSAPRASPDDGASPGRCSICFEGLREGTQRLPCGHVFHRRCLEPWVLRDGRTCPLCREPVPGPQPGRRGRPVSPDRLPVLARDVGGGWQEARLLGGGVRVVLRKRTAGPGQRWERFRREPRDRAMLPNLQDDGGWLPVPPANRAGPGQRWERVDGGWPPVPPGDRVVPRQPRRHTYDLERAPGWTPDDDDQFAVARPVPRPTAHDDRPPPPTRTRSTPLARPDTPPRPPRAETDKEATTSIYPDSYAPNYPRRGRRLDTAAVPTRARTQSRSPQTSPRRSRALWGGSGARRRRSSSRESGGRGKCAGRR